MHYSMSDHKQLEKTYPCVCICSTVLKRGICFLKLQCSGLCRCTFCTPSIRRNVLYLQLLTLCKYIKCRVLLLCKLGWDHIQICHHGSFIVWGSFAISCCTFFCSFTKMFGLLLCTWLFKGFSAEDENLNEWVLYCTVMFSIFDIYTVWPCGSVLTCHWRLNTLQLYCNSLSSTVQLIYRKHPYWWISLVPR